MPARSLQEKEGISFNKTWLKFFGKENRKKAPTIYTSLKFLTTVRCIYAVLVLIYSTLWMYSNEQLYIDFSTQLLLGCIIEIFIYTALCCVFLLKKRFIRPITYISMLHDSMLAAFVVFITGFHNSPFYYLFLIIPLYGGIILQRRGGVIGALIVSCVLFGFLEFLPKISIFLPHGPRELFSLLVLTSENDFYRILSLIFACFGVGILTGHLAHQYVRAQSDLIETDREFSHLRGIYEILLNALPVGIVILNPKTNRLLYANPSAKQLIGEDNAEFATQILIQPENTAQELEVGRSWQIEHERKHLQIARFELSLVGEIQLNGYHISDVTEIHQAQLERVKRQRMELLGEFSAKVAHEIRNPLACISGCNEMLQAEIETDEHKELLGMMGDEIGRLNNLLNDILLFSRRPKLNPVNLHLLELFQKRKTVFLNDAQNADLDIILEIPENTEILTDETSLTQIIMTLWRNSAEAMEGHGKIRTHFLEDSRTLQFFDDGPGLSPELALHVFEPFYTTKASGTGLGLSIARQLSLDNEMTLSWHAENKCFELKLNTSL